MVEAGAGLMQLEFEHDGFCPCCRADTVFEVAREWLRDGYICRRCGSIPRLRHIQTVLDERFPGWENLTIHESSPSSNFIERYALHYSGSQYFRGRVSGDFVDGVRCEDIENLSFADESIDLFITQDVLEHVFDPAAAVREVHRVLRPGGAHIFTTPKHKDLLQTRQRATRTADGDTQYLLEAEYHGSPVGDHRILVTYDYGYDFERLLSGWAGGTVETLTTTDRARGLDAEFNEVFIIAKAPAPTPYRLAKLHGDNLNEVLAAQQLQIHTAELEAHDRDEQNAVLRHTIHDFETSTSWRITAPIRTTLQQLRTLRTRTR